MTARRRLSAPGIGRRTDRDTGRRIDGPDGTEDIIVLASARYKRDTAAAREVRFNAFQGLYLFVAWLIVDWVVSPAIRFGAIGMGDAFRPLEGLLRVAILAAWIVMLVKVSHSEHYRLPIVGEMAERSVEEQRA